MVYIVFVLICIVYLIILILEALERRLSIKKEYLNKKDSQSDDRLESCIWFQYYPEDDYE
jgi:hypothetical protein